jgi:hypothetical protein
MVKLNLPSLPDMVQWDTQPPFKLADLENFKKAYNDNIQMQSVIQDMLNDESDPAQYANLE